MSDSRPSASAAAEEETLELSPLGAMETEEEPKAGVSCAPSSSPGRGALSATSSRPFRGHQRSQSHGGSSLGGGSGAQVSATDAALQERLLPTQEETQATNAGGGVTAEADEEEATSVKKVPPPLSAVAKRPALRAVGAGHRRVFSHGQIPIGGPAATMEAAATGDRASSAATASRGHRRVGSKTDFILPPGHEERERRRSVTRTGSYRGPPSSSAAAAAPPSSAGVADARRGSAFLQQHRRMASRSDSLAFSFRGHSRQASRTDSIYTLRQTAPNVKRKVFCFGRKRKKDGDGASGAAGEGEAKHRTIVPNHVRLSPSP